MKKHIYPVTVGERIEVRKINNVYCVKIGKSEPDSDDEYLIGRVATAEQSREEIDEGNVNKYRYEEIQRKIEELIGTPTDLSITYINARAFDRGTRIHLKSEKPKGSIALILKN